MKSYNSEMIYENSVFFPFAKMCDFMPSIIIYHTVCFKAQVVFVSIRSNMFQFIQRRKITMNSNFLL